MALINNFLGKWYPRTLLKKSYKLDWTEGVINTFLASSKMALFDIKTTKINNLVSLEVTCITHFAEITFIYFLNSSPLQILIPIILISILTRKKPEFS